MRNKQDVQENVLKLQCIKKLCGFCNISGHTASSCTTKINIGLIID